MKPEAAKESAKILTIQLTTGAEDERSLEELLDDVKGLLGDSVKRVTVFGSYYLIDGEAVRPENVPEPVEDEKPKRKPRGKVAKATPEPEPEDEDDWGLTHCSNCGEGLEHDEGTEGGLCGNCADRRYIAETRDSDAVRQLASKVAPRRMSMKKGEAS